MRIVIITGLSGSGKSTAMAAFEDAGYYCVDNMPVTLLPAFLELPLKSEISGLAFVMDLREKGFLGKYQPVFDGLRDQGWQFDILFMEADEKTLLRRYSQTRRHHPLENGKRLLEGVRAEKKEMGPLRAVADYVIDTSRYTVHELKSIILEMARKGIQRVPMRINVLSFGFKYGVPEDADLIMDVRFLTNPYFVPALKPLDGRSPEIQDFVLNREDTREFLSKYQDLLDYLIPLYEREGKAYLTIAVGCTGGRHRSVAIALSIYSHIKHTDRWVQLTHRDIDK